MGHGWEQMMRDMVRETSVNEIRERAVGAEIFGDDHLVLGPGRRHFSVFGSDRERGVLIYMCRNQRDYGQ